MKFGLILLISITGILLSISIPYAYSQLAPSNDYLLQATGYIVGKQSVQDSQIDLQFSTGGSSGTIPITLENGLVSISGNSYLNSGVWQSSVLRDGKYLVVTGNAKNSNGEAIYLNLFGRLIGTSQTGSVYWFSGKITGATETMQVAYSARVISTMGSTPAPTQTPTQNQGNTIQVSIVAGSSSPFNQIYFSPSSLQVIPGTTIVWTNNDSVPHTIQSGRASQTTIDSKPSFTSDGKINSGVIAPGKTFQYTVNDVGTITFFDPSYLWMTGVITSRTEIQTQVTATQISILQGASNFKTGQFLSPSSVQITPGSAIILTNNDSVPHRIQSGYLSGVQTQGSRGQSYDTQNFNFSPDGKFDSKVIAPGQTYQFTISGTGTTTFFDPTYTWINGIIYSISPTSTQNEPIQVSISPGSYQSQGAASQQNNFYYNHYYLPDNIQIIPGTTIVWTNNDSVPHTILSGTSTQQPQNPFIPDGKINSGVIAPGKTFQYTVNDVGIVRFYDPSYTWMNGVIVSVPTPSSKVIGAPSHNPGLN